MGKKKEEPKLPWPGEEFLEMRAHALNRMKVKGLGPLEAKDRRETWRQIEYWLKLTHDKWDSVSAERDSHGIDKMVHRLRREAGKQAFAWLEGLAN